MDTTNPIQFRGPGAEEYINSRSQFDGFVSSFVLTDQVICEEADEDLGEHHHHHSEDGEHHEHHHHHSEDGEHHEHHHHHHHHHRRKKKSSFTLIKEWAKRNKKVIFKAIGVIIALVIIGVLLSLISQGQTSQGEEYENNYNEEDGAMLYYGDSWYQERSDLETVLILGIDKMADDTEDDDTSYINTQQTDLNILVIIDKKAKTYTLLQLNRDTMTQVKKLGLNAVNLGYEVMQLALAHTYGTGGKDSCRNTVDAVEKLLYNITIDHYVAFTMDAVSTLNDLVGGVTVHIEDDFTGINDRFVQGTDVTLTGEEALQYVRARTEMTDDPSNIARMRRQREYMYALEELVMAKVAASDSWALKTVAQLADYTVSDMSYQEIAYIMDSVEGFDSSEIITPEGTVTTTDYVEFYADETKLKELVLDLFYKKSQEE